MIVQNLCKSYSGRRVLENLNFNLGEGEIYALTGASGSGKTTLLHIIMGLVKPDSGSVSGISGKRISAVFQEDRLCEFLTAGENVAIVQSAAKNAKEEFSAADMGKILAEILPAESLSRKVSTYSGGMKRRVAIARAMVADSDILIMDEPLSGLDDSTKEQVISFILKYRRGRTLLFSTHDKEDILAFQAKEIMLSPVSGM